MTKHSPEMKLLEKYTNGSYVNCKRTLKIVTNFNATNLEISQYKDARPQVLYESTETSRSKSR